MRVYLRTLGCQMNVRDSEIVRGMLEEEGYNFVGDEKEADIVIFNTCSVREHAEHRAISNLGFLIKKDIEKNKVFGLIGCVAQHRKEELFRKLPGLGFICGPSDIYEIGEILNQLISSSAHQLMSKREKKERGAAWVSQKARSLDNINPNYRESKTHAFVNITYGCNNYCSYCIVPYVRGPEVSRPVEDILEEVKDLAKRGISHITLLGQNVNSYSAHRAERILLRQGYGGQVAHSEKNGTRYTVHGTRSVSFMELLRLVHEIEGIEKISFVTSHPKDANKELFEAIAKLPKIDRYLHLPLQSGSNRILELMNRGYTIEKYKKLIEDYRELVPDAKLSTDIIVGFPTENEEDFEMTRKAVEEIKFNNVYIFKYSPRPPAKSAELADDVLREVKEERHAELLELQKRLSSRVTGNK